MRIMIAGSRYASTKMLAQVRAAVDRIAARGDVLFVGDADGIDAAAIAHAHEIGVEHYVFTRVGMPPRNTSPSAIVVQEGAWFRDRDRIMAHRADMGYFVWNGKSKGTRAVYNFMTQLGKPAFLWEPA